MRWGQSIATLIAVLGTALVFQGCGTVGALGNFVNGIIGGASQAAGKTLNAAGNTASKALTPSTYSDLAKKAKKQPRSYHAESSAPRTSARNADAKNARSNSVSKNGGRRSAQSFFRGNYRR